MWATLADRLANTQVGLSDTGRFLRSLMPIRDDMSDKQVENTKANRETIMRILASPTCTGIGDTVYGLVQATIEWADHEQPAHSDQTRSARTLLRSNPVKQKAFSIAMGMLN